MNGNRKITKKTSQKSRRGKKNFFIAQILVRIVLFFRAIKRVTKRIFVDLKKTKMTFVYALFIAMMALPFFVVTVASPLPEVEFPVDKKIDETVSENDSFEETVAIESEPEEVPATEHRELTNEEKAMGIDYPHNHTETLSGGEADYFCDGCCEPIGFPEFAEEVNLLARMIQCEAGPTREDKIYVGSVIINRARTTYIDFRDVHTIHDVLYQGYYSAGPQQYDTHTIRRIESGEQPSEEAIEVAQGLINGDIECLREDLLMQTTYRPGNCSNLTDANLPGACQYYGYIKDYWDKVIIE